MKRLFLTLAGAVLFAASLHAGASAQVMVRGIEFPPGEAEKILRITKLEERYAAVEKAVEEGKALDIETFVAATPIGGRAVIDSIGEVTYPTELRDLSCAIMGGDLSAPPKRPPIPGNILKHEAAMFDTRVTGASYDLIATPDSDSGTFEVRGRMNFVLQEPDRPVMKHEFFKGWPQILTRPVFRVIKLDFDVTVPEGEWMLVGMVDSWRKGAPARSRVLLWVSAETIDRMGR